MVMAEFSKSGIGSVLAYDSTKNPSNQRSLLLDSARQIGLEAVLMELLIVD